jgi:hypothetical protein
MNFYNLYIKFIFLIKIIFIILAVYEKYLKRKEPKNKTKIQKITFFKERVEVLFKGLMSVLLFYLFNPRTSKDVMKIDYETRLLLALFGFILLFTADWEAIFKNIPKTFQTVQEILGSSK